MKLSTIAILVAFLGWGQIGTAMACPKVFGASSLKGSYLMTIDPDTRAEDLANTGTLNQATLGLLNVDGAGKISGSATAVDNVDGPITATVTGTYQVASNGTGVITLTAGPNPPFNRTNTPLYFVLSDTCGARADFFDGNGGYDAADQGTLTKQIGSGFRASTLKGSYVLTVAGQPGVAIGLVSFDGGGGFTGTALASASGGYVLLSGTYSINTDGTGTMEFPSIPFLLGTRTWQFVIGDSSGSGASFINVGEGEEDNAGFGIAWGSFKKRG